YGYGELSYEIDTLRLLSVSYNQFSGSNNSEREMDVDLKEFGYGNTNIIYNYKQRTDGTNAFGGPSVRADYQRSFAGVKDRLLTFSYNFNTSPQKSSGETTIDDVLNNRQSTDGSSSEHTLQLDFTTPVNKIHTIEAGIKYIQRTNKNESE
ncbi:outer membrane beta-barrel protein, partial [Candidatus Symbiothrix dinenymphae]|uniref:outer membrane beta-barrel protein n=1 Tax=Candidatus Symbiothrix dinenymphae TaxID=467085 RepID=UPI000AB22DC8